MKTSTLSKYASTKSAVQSVIKIKSIGTLINYQATVILRYKGIHEFTISFWIEEKEDLEKEMNKKRIEESKAIIRRINLFN